MSNVPWHRKPTQAVDRVAVPSVGRKRKRLHRGRGKNWKVKRGS